MIRASELAFAIGEAAGLSGDSASARCAADIISIAAAAMPSDCARRRPRRGMFTMLETLPEILCNAQPMQAAEPPARNFICGTIGSFVLANPARLLRPI